MAKQLSKSGIATGLDIEAHHVSQSVDAFTGTDAYDITISGSLKVTGSTSITSVLPTQITYGDITTGELTGDNNFTYNSSTGVLSASIFNTDYITAIQVTTSTQIYSPGNIIGSPLTSLSSISAASNIVAVDDMSSTNMYASNLITAYNISASNNISAENDLTVGNNITASNDIIAGNNISASGDIYGTIISASNDLIAGDDIIVGDDITFENTLPRINTPNQPLLQTSTTLQQINLAPSNVTTLPQVAIYAGLTSGINLRQRDNDIPTSSLDIANYDSYASIAYNHESFASGPFYILNDVSVANGGGVTHFGNNTSFKFISVFGTGSTDLTNNNWGLKIATGGALEVNSDQVYNVGGVVWGTTSDSRLKDNIVTASLDTCYDNVKNLPLMYYKWKDEMTESPLQDQNVLGWIAQDVKSIFPKAVQTGKFTTWSTYTGSEVITGSDGKTILEPGNRYQDVLAGSEIMDDRHTLQSDQIIKMMYGAIQKLQEKVEALEAQISGSNP